MGSRYPPFRPISLSLPPPLCFASIFTYHRGCGGGILLLCEKARYSKPLPRHRVKTACPIKLFLCAFPRNRVRRVHVNDSLSLCETLVGAASPLGDLLCAYSTQATVYSTNSFATYADLEVEQVAMWNFYCDPLRDDNYPLIASITYSNPSDRHLSPEEHTPIKQSKGFVTCSLASSGLEHKLPC